MAYNLEGEQFIQDNYISKAVSTAQDTLKTRGIPRPEDHLKYYEESQINSLKSEIIEAMHQNKREILICESPLPSVKQLLIKLGYGVHEDNNWTYIQW